MTPPAATDVSDVIDVLGEPARARGPRRRWQRAFGLVSRAMSKLGKRVYSSRARELFRAHVDAGREPREVPIRPPARAAPALSGLRLALVSDLHVGFFLDPEDLAALVGRLAAARPDAILLCGDLVNQFPDECSMLVEGLGELRAPLGMFAVPGNHDYYADRSLRRWRNALDAIGARVLLNQGVRIERAGGSVWLAGVDDLREGEPDLDAALAGRERGEPTLLLSHHPDFFVQSASAGVDLTVSGHTHGGQVLLAGHTPLRHTRHGFWAGHYAHGASQLYVGRGAGVSFLPVRRGAPPELPVLVLEPGP